MEGWAFVRRLLVVFAVLAALLVVADRVAVAVADRAVARQIHTELALAETPSVSIRGIPFLTQALRGRYEDVRVRIANLDSGPLRGIDVDARLAGVRAPLRDLIGGRIDQVPVRQITGVLSVGYDDLARASGIRDLRITPTGDRLRVTGRVQVLGRTVEAAATGRVTVEDNDLLLTAEEATVAGLDAPAPVLAAAARLLSFRVSASGLPLALRITGVQTRPDALAVTAEARDVLLRRGEIATSR